MKILLFGEFSGLMNCLKDGLEALGQEVFIASDGNGYKNYPSNFRWDAGIGWKLGKLHSIFFAINIWLHKKLFKGYDVVYLIDPNLISRIRWINEPIYNFIIKNNKLVYQCGCGDTCFCVDYWYDSKTKYHEYYEGYKIEGNFKNYKNHRLKKWEKDLLNKINGYIPIWYEYAEPYRNLDCSKKAIRIPIDLNQFNYRPNIVKEKIVFYHGVNRECKGTRFIRKAFELMEQKYKDKAEFICASRLPFNEYMRVMEKVNVIVDDANSYSIAMNGLFSLQKGRIVMGGAEHLGNKELGIPDEENPVFNINPDVEQICSVITYIISNKDKIEEWGLAGRKYVEKYYDSVAIAREYMDLWTNDLKNKKIGK